MPCREEARWTPFWQCVERLERPAGLVTRVYPEYNNSVARARNLIAREALADGAHAIVWLDDDLMFEPDVLLKLLARPEDIVIGLTMMRAPRAHGQFRPIWSDQELSDDWYPVTEIKTGPNGLMPLVSGTGGGVLTRRTVFERVPSPWWQIGQVERDMFWEDIFFYAQARAAGFEIWGDPTVRFGHYHKIVIWPHQDSQTGLWTTLLANGMEAFVQTPMFANAPPAHAGPRPARQLQPA